MGEAALTTAMTNLFNELHVQNQNNIANNERRLATEATRDRARRQADILKASSSAGKYNVGQNWMEFRLVHESWRNSHLVDQTDANGVNVMPADMQAKILLACFQGQAASRVKQLGIGTPAWNLTILEAGVPENDRFNNYFDRLEREFRPAEESPLAKQEFAARTQSVDEDVASYVGH